MGGGTYSFTLHLSDIGTAVGAGGPVSGTETIGGGWLYDNVYGLPPYVIPSNDPNNAPPIVLNYDKATDDISVQIEPTTSDWIDAVYGTPLSDPMPIHDYGGIVDGYAGTVGGGQDIFAYVDGPDGSSDEATSATEQPYNAYTIGNASIQPVYCQLWSGVEILGISSEDTSVFGSNIARATLKYDMAVIVYNWFGHDPSDYFDVSNWSAGAVPNAVDAVAMLGYQDSGRQDPQPATTVTLSQNLTLGTLLFDNPNSYTVNGPSTFTLQASGGNDAEVIVSQGSHVINATTALASNTDFYIAPNAQLSISSNLSTDHLMSLSGGGQLSLANVEISSGGALIVSAGSADISGLQVDGGATAGLVGNPDGTGTTIASSGEMHVGSGASGNAVFNQSGGTNSITGSLLVSGSGGPSAAYNLNAGAVNCYQLEIGNDGSSGSSAFTQTGGSITTAGFSMGGEGSHSNNYSMSGGTLSARSELIGSEDYSMGAMFFQSGGSNSVNSALVVGPVHGIPVVGTEYTITGGSLSAQSITVNKYGTFNYDGGTVTGEVDNYGTFNVSGGSETLYGDGGFYNESGATLKTYGTTFTIIGNFYNYGTYSSDPASNHFATLSVGKAGVLLGGVGDRFFISGDLLSGSQNRIAWNTTGASLIFAGGDHQHILDITGADLGASWSGFENNFAWGVLDLADGDSLNIEDTAGQAGGLYIGTLDLAGGLEQLADLSAEDVNIYYVADLNPWLNDRPYLLDGGGQLLPVDGEGGMFDMLRSASLVPVPEPTSIALLSVAAVGVIRRRKAAGS